MRSLRTYIDIFKKKGFLLCLFEVEMAFWSMLGCLDWIATKQAKRTSRYLLRHYKQIITPSLQHPEVLPQQSKIIWICWLQGREQAPEIVKRCIASVEKWASGYEIRFLTANNLWDYVTMPDWIKEKYEKGIISFTHFSDILRTCLLVEHGGIWLDATVLLTDKIPQYMTDEPLFVFQTPKNKKIHHHGSNWLIVSQPGNPVLRRMQELLFAYWKKENAVRDYYIYHVFMYLLKTNNKDVERAFAMMPYVDNIAVHTLQYSLFKQYTESDWKDITGKSSVHKLTWKFRHGEPVQLKGTNYDYILHHLYL